ncbi:hypothetical protein QEH42_gp174 [Microbacterium phage Pumpernickel]|uniref:Uncharacterized protein n=1 Tax=Microbacterium phage Pumpernickel TaxID=2885983 RepID=A0AAE8Y7C3_9CAUD|nr:hypothetical protein QEH42_gp174 [Microbacterium phage Pumpernickel]UDL16044.1 hypothetical protein SEA_PUMPERNICKEL_294 [Microbacterium phage Pumpernickel]
MTSREPVSCVWKKDGTTVWIMEETFVDNSIAYYWVSEDRDVSGMYYRSREACEESVFLPSTPILYGRPHGSLDKLTGRE